LARTPTIIEEARTFGVKIGDWIEYGNFTAEYSSTDPTAKEDPPDIVEHRNIGWIRNTVVNFSDSMVLFESLLHFENNQTDSKSTEKVDIETGFSTHELRAAFMFVSANLVEGESIYEGEFAVYKINKTDFREYLQGKTRETNHLSGSTITYIDIDQVLAVSIDYYWDRETGILCEYLGRGALTKNEYTISWSQSFRIIDTNVKWTEQDDGPPDGQGEYSPIIVGAIVAVVAVTSIPVAYFIWSRKYKRRRRRRR
jgi:hypothetical protein